MDVVSKGPLRVASLVFRPSAEAWTLAVIARATLWLAPGEATLCETQFAPNERDVMERDGIGVRAPSDLLPFKAGVDVLVVGSAYAPGGAPVRSIRARLAIGRVDKSIDVASAAAAGGVLAGTPTPLPRDRGGFAPNAVRWSGGWLERPLADFDPSQFNVAPPDQRLAQLAPDDVLTLDALHPRCPRLAMRLPAWRPYAALSGDVAGGEDVPLVADTILIDTDALLVTITYRGSVALSHARESGLVEVHLAPQGRAVALHDDDDDGATHRMNRDEAPTIAEVNPPSRVLPFGAPKSPWVGFKQPIANAAPDREDTGTVLGGKVSARDVLPFAWNVARAEPNPKPSIVGPAAAPAEAAAPSPALDVEPRAEDQTSVADEPAVDGQAESSPSPSPSAPPAEVAAPPAVGEAPALPLDRFPLERCAQIAASLARRPDEQPAILASNEIDAGTWRRLDRHYAEVLKQEASRSTTKLLHAYDDAYVARLDEERGPIQVDDYARLTVAAERGGADALLVELGLPKKSLIRIARVWLKRSVADPTLGKEIARAVKRARDA